MSHDPNEEDELRSVTFHNARSVFLARQRAEDELMSARESLWRQSELLRVTLSSIGDAVITTDTDARVVSLNPVAEALTGWTTQDAHGCPLAEVFRIVNEQTREPAENPAVRALAEGSVVGLANHVTLIARDGRETPIDDSAAPIRDEHGHVHGVVLVFRSIAERRDAERSLLRSERELADFFENAAVGLHWAGPDGIVLRVNKAELDLLGYDRDDYVGHHISEFHVDPNVIEDLVRRLAEGETIRDFEARVRSKDGSIKHVLIDASVLWEDGRFVHTRSFTRDITDRKQAEAAQARLAAIVETSQDAIVSKTLEGRILTWNAGAEHLFGHTAAEVIGRSITIVIPPERQHEEDLILERMRRGERIEHYETVRVAKNGRRVDVSLSISPIRDRAGRVIAVSKIARDITERRRAEQRLATQYGITRTLAEAGELQQAAGDILRAICEHLEWHVGVLWEVDAEDDVLRPLEVCHGPRGEAPVFEAASRERSFQKGIGLPGRVWADAQAVFIPDVTQDTNFPRAAAAEADGLHSAFGFPIMLNDEVLGVMEFFSQAILQPDDYLLQMMSSVGSQLGQFIERKRAEAALNESVQRFQLMAASIPSIIWTADPDGTITYANDQWFEYCGLTPEENREWPDRVLHPDDRERCMAAWTAALENGTSYEVEIRNRRKDGVYRWFVTRAVPMRDASGRIEQWFGTTTDIDDRIRAEQTTRFLADASAALARLTDYESTLQRLAGLAVPHFADFCAVDMQEPDGSIRRLAVTHVDPGKVQLIREFGRIFLPHPTDPRGPRRVLLSGERDWAPEISDDHLRDRLNPAIAQQLKLKSFISVPLKSHTKVFGVLTFATAESGRVYDMDDVRAAEDLANRAVIAIENAMLLATLKDADRRKDEFLAMLAHELRNPLAPIRNAAQMFRSQGGRIPELQWATEVIDRQVHHMARLVDDLLDVSRITRGKIELRKEIVDLKSVVETAVEASRPLLEKWGHKLGVTLPASTILLEADPPRMAQVIVNLLNNAAKYTDHGGTIDLTAERENDHVRIRVKDNGIGIPADALPHIFEMFTQVDRSRERAEGGLGLGLTLVKRLVEMHGGTVEVRSEGLGKGSEFIVHFPIVPEGEHLAPARHGEKTLAPPTRRILIVDDNQDAAYTLSMLLRTAGNEVATAYDGLEAVDAAASFKPDVVLLDIGLPRLNGYDVARRIRQQESGADILLVALTGWGQEDDRRRSVEAGFDYHMTKPIEFEALKKLLAETGGHRPT